MKKLIFFQAPHSALRCHGTLSILSITHGNHITALGLLADYYFQSVSAS